MSVLRAAEFAARAHAKQRRKNTAGDPYINHPLAVARLLEDCGVPYDTILIAAILHDVIEDTPVTFEEVRKEFGPEVHDFVMQVTDDKSLSKCERKKLQIVHAREKMSTGSSWIKIADKIDNCRSLFSDPPKGWSDDDIEGYLAWSTEVVLAASERLNLKEEGGTSHELYQLFSAVIQQWKRTPNLLENHEKRAEILERYYATMTTAK